MTTPGIDISNNNGDIGWAAVAAAGYQFAIAKAVEGTSFLDPCFLANWSGMKIAGIARGAYAFARPDLGTNPKDEADFFLSVVAPVLEDGDVLALDLETGSDFLGGWALTWLEYVAARVGFRPLIYTSPGFIAAHGLNLPEFADFGLWLASWSPSETIPPAPPPWEFVAIHQHSDHGQVPGIAGPVDLNRFNGSIDQFRAYGKPAPAAAPDRAPLDSWYAAWQDARAAFDHPADLAEWDAMMPHFDQIKARNSIYP